MRWNTSTNCGFARTYQAAHAWMHWIGSDNSWESACISYLLDADLTATKAKESSTWLDYPRISHGSCISCPTKDSYSWIRVVQDSCSHASLESDPFVKEAFSFWRTSHFPLKNLIVVMASQTLGSFHNPWWLHKPLTCRLINPWLVTYAATRGNASVGWDLGKV